MKKVILIPLFFIMILNASAFTDVSEGGYAAVIINVLTAILILSVSIQFYKFANITRNNPLFVFAYSVLGLLLFSSILNIFFFLSDAPLKYLPVYYIDRIILLLIILILTIGFRRFRKLLATKH